MARNTLINQLIRKISIAPFVLRYKGGQIIEGGKNNNYLKKITFELLERGRIIRANTVIVGFLQCHWLYE